MRDEGVTFICQTARSKGNKQKVGLVAALQHRPDLLVLDEPTAGLDPLVQQTFFEVLREAVADGHTVFLSSHVLSEAEKACDRVAGPVPAAEFEQIPDAAALAGVGFAVGGVFRTTIAAEIVALIVIATYLIDLLSPALKLPDLVHQFALTAHLGQPMVGTWDWAGVAACLVLAFGGLLLGGWGMRRRDVAR